MIKNTTFRSNYAVSEVLCGVLLIIIAVSAFSIYYVYLYPPAPDTAFNVDISGQITTDGDILLTHVGGDPLDSYKIVVYDQNYNYLGEKVVNDADWEIGEIVHPLDGITDLRLVNDSISVIIKVFYVGENDEELEVFSWTPKGEPEPSAGSLEDPMLISSLRRNTTDEDLICYTNSILSNITFDLEYLDWDINLDWQIDNEDVFLVEDAYGQTGSPGWIREDINDDGQVNYLDVSILVNHSGESQITYIYNWTINGEVLANIILPFDTNSSVLTKDYSSNQSCNIYGPKWNNNNSIIGGCYYFDGIDDYITIPFNHGTSFIDDITIETWINTSSDQQVISSFNQDKYWELGIKNGVVRFSTTSNGNTTHTFGETIVNDTLWHFVAASYDSTTGYSTIYVDDHIDRHQLAHNPGEVLGDASQPSGSIGKGTGSATEETIFSTGFETEEEEDKWDENDYRTSAYWWEDYDFELLSADSISPRSGSYSLGGAGNFDPRYAVFDREGIDISDYSDVTVSLYYSYKSTESSDDIAFFYWDGDSWEAIFEEYSPYIGEGNQLDWTFASAQIPDSIDTLYLEFAWSSSSSREYLAIDDLTITGIPSTGSNNFSGYIDEFRIYNKKLSDEQVFQNYLCGNQTLTSKNIIVSQETTLGQSWRCSIIPNNGIRDDIYFISNKLDIIPYGGG